MYSMSRLDAKSTRFVSTVMSTGKNRTKPFLIALAFVIARSLQVPVVRSEDILDEYRLQCSVSVSARLGVYNEFFPVSREETERLIKAFYQQRAKALYPDLVPMALREGKGVVDFFGLSRFFSEEDLTVIHNESEALTRYVAEITHLVEIYEASRRKEYDSSGAPRVVDVYVA